MSATQSDASQPKSVAINEVSTRDGFQMESQFIATEDKVALLDRLSAAGYKRIEVTSFTSPKAIPMLRDAEAVMQQIRRHPDVIYTALVPNIRGAERALESMVDEFNLVMSVSETHNLTNLRMTREQSFTQLSGVIARARAADVPVNVSLSCVFGCPMEGDIDTDELMHWIHRFAQESVAGITLCDTTGMAYPSQVRAIAEAAVSAHPELEFCGHFHNTRGMGLANILAALEAGITSFDASLGGVGGCPYAPGASGNVATEDVVHMLECMGYDTGVDLDRLLEATVLLRELIGHDVPSQLSHAGPRTVRHPVPADFEQIRDDANNRDSSGRRPPQ